MEYVNSMTYSNEETQIVFLKDADIVNNMSGLTISGNTILSNGIPSYDLFRKYYNETSGDISVLSDDVSALSDFTKKAVVYNNTLLTATTVPNQNLTVYLNDNFKDAGFKFKHGYMYHLNVGHELSDDSGISNFIGVNDYIIFNNDKALSDVKFEDIDLIRDAMAETSSIAKALSNDISTLSNNISALISDITANVEYLSSEISSNDNDIEYLSSAVSSKIWIKDPAVDEFSAGKHSDLSVVKLPIAEYASKSISKTLSGNTLYILSADYVEAFGQVISNMTMTDDPTESEAASKHYVDTLRSDATLSASNLCAEVLSIDTRYTNTFTDKDRTADSHISSDNLILTDFNEHISPTVDTHKQYYATFESGTIVLKPLNF